MDIALEVVHIAVIVFNLVGWVFPRTRFLHWLSVNITAFSWLVMGFFYGFGYCFLTDWHWQVKASLDNMPQESSFITYFLYKIGLQTSERTIDLFTAITFACIFLLSWVINFRRLKNFTMRILKVQ